MLGKLAYLSAVHDVFLILIYEGADGGDYGCGAASERLFQSAVGHRLSQLVHGDKAFLYRETLVLKKLDYGLSGDSGENGSAQLRGNDHAVYKEEHVHGADFLYVLALHAVQPQHLGISLLLGSLAGSVGSRVVSAALCLARAAADRSYVLVLDHDLYRVEAFFVVAAYRRKDYCVGGVLNGVNAKRANKSNERLCIPYLPEEDFIQAVEALVRVDRDWIPTGEGESLYLRPFIIATDEFLGVAPSKTYLFMVIASPSGAYYASGLNPVGIWIEDEYVRAVRGGMGFAKTGGNYAASLIGQVKAHDEGFAQVLWLDGVERKYIEEVGSMNIFFKINGTIVTPMLNGSILPGVTRDSVLQLCRHWGLPVEEKRISVDELLAAQHNGTLEEVFGTGTAAVVSPVGKLRYGDEVMTINGGGIGPVTQKLYDTITGIQLGRLDDPLGWRVEIK